MGKSTCKKLGVLFVGVPSALTAAVRVTGNDYGYQWDSFVSAEFAVVLLITLVVGGWGLGTLAGIALWKALNEISGESRE